MACGSCVTNVSSRATEWYDAFSTSSAVPASLHTDGTEAYDGGGAESSAEKARTSVLIRMVIDSPIASEG